MKQNPDVAASAVRLAVWAGGSGMGAALPLFPHVAKLVMIAIFSKRYEW